MTYKELLDSILAHFVAVHEPCKGKEDLERWMQHRNHYIMSFLLSAHIEGLKVKDLARLIAESDVDVEALGYDDLHILGANCGWWDAFYKILMSILRHSVVARLPRILLNEYDPVSRLDVNRLGYIWHGKPGPVARIDTTSDKFPRVNVCDERLIQLCFGSAFINLYGDRCPDYFEGQGVFDLAYPEERMCVEVYAIQARHGSTNTAVDATPFLDAAIKNGALQWVRSAADARSDTSEGLNSRR